MADINPASAELHSVPIPFNRKNNLLCKSKGSTRTLCTMLKKSNQ